MSIEKPLLNIVNLTKRYDEQQVLNGINLQVNAGEFVVIIGSSGAGKSTLVRCINQLIKTTSGIIEVDGVDITQLKGKKLREARSSIGMIFQHHNLIERTNVLKNVLYGRLGYHSFIKTLFGRYTHQERLKALDLLTRVGLKNDLYKKANTLSGGQMQRVGVCRAIMQASKLILADEPIASLDPMSAAIIMKELKRLVTKDNLACIVNLHQIHFAKAYATRIVGIKNGQIVFDGKPSLLTEALIADIYEGNIDEVEYDKKALFEGEFLYAT